MKWQYNFPKSVASKVLNQREIINDHLLFSLRIIIYIATIISIFVLILSGLQVFIYSAGTVAVFYLLFAVGLITLSWELYHRYAPSGKSLLELSKSPLAQANLADYFDPLTAGKVMRAAAEIAVANHRQQIEAVDIIAALSQEPSGKFIYLRAGLPIEPKISRQVKKLIRDQAKNNLSLSNETFRVLGQAAAIAHKEHQALIDSIDIISAFNITDKLFSQLLEKVDLKNTDIENIINWYKRLKKISDKKYFWQPGPLGAGIGIDWQAGYINFLAKYSFDVSRYFNDPTLEIQTFGHSKKIAEIESVLARSGKNNCLLIGEAGVGKKTIVNAFALKVNKGESLLPLRYKRIRQLDLSHILGEGQNQEEINSKLVGCLREATYVGNVILFINGIEGLVNYADLFRPFLESEKIQIIGSTTPDAYHRQIEKNSLFANLFEKVEIAEPSVEETINILEEAVLFIEYRNKVFVPYPVIKKIVDLTARYVHNLPFPEKAIRVLDEMAVSVSKQGRQLIKVTDVEKIITAKTKVPVGEVSQVERKKLVNMEEELHRRIIDQEEAVKVIADALRRIRAGLGRGHRPAGVFLFLGPTGVGKTETAKALADIYYGSETKMIRFDMSEYQEQASIERLIQGLSDQVRDDPFSLVLLDEMEKANIDILNLFLQVFEDGRLTDRQNRVLDFSNAIIIATSNAGSELIRQYIEARKPLEELKEKLMDNLQKEGIFRPEFLNRFDAIVAFKPLTEEHLIAIAKLMLGEIAKKLEEDKGVSLQVTDPAIKKLAQLGYSPTYGARPLRRVITEKIENELATQILKGTAKKGEKIVINEIN